MVTLTTDFHAPTPTGHTNAEEGNGEDSERPRFRNVGVIGNGLPNLIAEHERIGNGLRCVNTTDDTAECRTEIAAGGILEA